MRTFTFSDATSHKFWNIELKGKSFEVAFGKIGAKGQAQVKEFPDEARARKEHDKLVQEKLKKGYVETTAAQAPTGPAPTSLREALEAAILANPDDRAAHAAYADHLMEQGDPRGEFIQAQLALEDANLPAAARKKLQQREKKLLDAHQAEWVGDWAALARYDGPEGRGQLHFPEPRPARFVRGILAEVAVGELTVECARALARAPQARLVRKLAIGGYANENAGEYPPGPDVPPGVNEYDDAASHALLRLPQLADLRSFQLGWTSDEEYGDFCHFQCHLDGSGAYELIRKMPRLEELYLFAHRVETHKLFALPMPNLRVLQVYHSHNYPLNKLAANPSLTRLTHLLFHPHAVEDELPITLEGLRAVLRSPHLKALTHLRLRLTVFGDKGVTEIVKSGILGRLKVLDLRNGRVSDKGARALAACPEVRGWKCSTSRATSSPRKASPR